MREGIKLLLVTFMVLLYSTYSSADADMEITKASPVWTTAESTKNPESSTFKDTNTTTITGSSSSSSRRRNSSSRSGTINTPTITTIPTATAITTKISPASSVPGQQNQEEEQKIKGSNSDVADARTFLAEYNGLAEAVFNAASKASWTAKTNITEEHTQNMVEMQLLKAQFLRDKRTTALQFNLTAMPYDVARQLDKILFIGTSAFSDQAKLKQLKDTIAEMESIYSTAKVCNNPRDPRTCLLLEPDITRIMKTSRDYDELLRLWEGWRDASGRKIKDLYTKYVQLSNEAVSELGFRHLGESWRYPYERLHFETDLHKLLDQVWPLYEQLHAFVRRRLREFYGEDKFPSSGHIPAHLLGNMWAQHWDGILDLVKPYKNKEALDVTDEMVKQKYTVIKMFRTAESFFVSLGLEPMVKTFWKRSMLKRPSGREVVCHASAWDFYDRKDYRIKMCTVVTQADFTTVHHEMGHIQYQMLYKDQPIVFRTGANPGFHEAIGDVMSLSVQTPQHLHRLKLLKKIPNDPETDINFLMNIALQKVAFLPFGFLIDMWRWSVFRGNTSPKFYNRDWWDIRCRVQGISPPVGRSESDFDPGAKFHVPGDVPYIRYFVSFIIQFQFHKAACKLAGHKGPLHLCDIYKSKNAGKKIREMLSMGASQPWPETMKILTGGEKMDASALLEYFKPLHDFLVKENGKDFGWKAFCPTSGSKTQS